MEWQARIEALEAELVELRRLADSQARTTVAGEPEVTSRRRLLGRAGAVAIGAAAGALATTAPAAADDPNDLTLGATKVTSGQTGASSTASVDGVSFLFQCGTKYTPASSTYNAALAGWATDNSPLVGPVSGVYAYTEIDDSSGLVARNEGNGGAGVYAVHTGSGAGLWAQSSSGAALVLEAGGAPPAMPPASGTWMVGSLVRTTDGHLWYCTVGGTGAASTWVRLSGGGINLLATPQRALDTRPGMGPFEGDDTRTISLRTWGVPAGATGALLNLTVTDTSGYGYLQAYSAALAAPPATSNLNWYPGARIVANSATVAVNAAGEIKLTSQGGTAQVLVDVVGYID